MNQLVIPRDHNPPLRLLATREALQWINGQRPNGEPLVSKWSKDFSLTVNWAMEIAGGDYKMGEPYSGLSTDRVLWIHVRPADGLALIYTSFTGATGGFSLMNEELYQEILPLCEEVGWS